MLLCRCVCVCLLTPVLALGNDTLLQWLNSDHSTDSSPAPPTTVADTAQRLSRQGQWTELERVLSTSHSCDDASSEACAAECALSVLVSIGLNRPLILPYSATATPSGDFSSICQRTSWTSSLAAYESHESLWLVTSELQHILATYGEDALLRTMHNTAPLCRDCTTELDRIVALMGAFERLVIEPLSLRSGFVYEKFSLEMHAKLAVFWDELGAREASLRHHHMYAVASLASHPLVHQHNCLCLAHRAIVASSPIHQSIEQLHLFRRTQVDILSRLLSATTSTSLDAEACHRMRLYERYFTTTPVAMMIGYDTSVLDATLLRLATSLTQRLGEPQALEAFSWQATSPSPAQRTRVGFLSCFFYDHSVGRLVNNLIVRLSQHFDVHVFILTACTGYAHDDFIDRLQTSVSNTYTIPNAQTGSHRSAAFTAKTIRFLRAFSMDIMVYPELGMDVYTLEIAQHRVAASHVVFWGHPVSQNIPSIDYCISSELFESDLIQRSEQVILVQGLTIAFDKPVVIEAIHSTAQTLEPYLQTKRIYLAPHTLMKYSVAFDSVLLRVLQADPQGWLVLLYSSSQALWFYKLRLRLHATCSNHTTAADEDAMDCVSCMQRLLFRPKLPKQEYLALLAHSAVVIDSFPFGMGVTALEAFSLNTPVVTHPSRQSTLQLVAGMLRVMDIPELIAHSDEEFVGKILLAAKEGPFRSSVRGKLLTSSHVLFDDFDVTHDWARLFRQLVQG